MCGAGGMVSVFRKTERCALSPCMQRDNGRAFRAGNHRRIFSRHTSFYLFLFSPKDGSFFPVLNKRHIIRVPAPWETEPACTHTHTRAVCCPASTVSRRRERFEKRLRPVIFEQPLHDHRVRRSGRVRVVNAVSGRSPREFGQNVAKPLGSLPPPPDTVPLNGLGYPPFLCHPIKVIARDIYTVPGRNRTRAQHHTE